MSEGPVSASLRAKRQAAFAPQDLVIEDDSARHAGHHHEGGVDGRDGGESHFNVTVVSAAFAGQGRVQRQRAVNALLREELAGPVHALSIRALTPDEAAAAG